MTIVQVKTKSRWTVEDKPWLLETVEYLKKDGYPKVARLLLKEIEKL